MENETGRAYIETESVGPTDKGGYLASRDIECFDGVTSMGMLYKGWGAKIGDYGKPTGWIDHKLIIGDSILFMNVYAGLDIFAAFYNEGRLR